MQIDLSGDFQKINSQQWANWLDRRHNHLRISRVLTAMKDFGLEKPAQDLLKFLKQEADRDEPERVSGQVLEYLRS